MIMSLQLDGKLGQLTINNAPLVKRIYETHQITDPINLVRSGLYKPDKWDAVIGNDVPQGVEKADYAKHMASIVTISYPTAVVAEMMNNDEIKLLALMEISIHSSLNIPIKSHKKNFSDYDKYRCF